MTFLLLGWQGIIPCQPVIVYYFARMKILEVAMEIALPPETLASLSKRYGFRPTREAAMSTSVGGIGPLLRERIIAQGD